MKDPMQVSWWRYFLYSIDHWSWCTLHYPDRWYRKHVRAFRYNTLGGIVLVIGLYLLIAAGIAVAIEILQWLFLFD